MVAFEGFAGSLLLATAGIETVGMLLLGSEDRLLAGILFLISANSRDTDSLNLASFQTSHFPIFHTLNRVCFPFKQLHSIFEFDILIEIIS